MLRQLSQNDLFRCFSFIINDSDVYRFAQIEGVKVDDVHYVKNQGAEELFDQNSNLILSLENRLLIYNYCFLYSFKNVDKSRLTNIRIQLNISIIYDKILAKIFSTHASVTDIKDRLDVLTSPSDSIIELIDDNISHHKKEGFYNTFKVLDGLPYDIYEHPKDRSALDALEGTPGIETAVKFFNKHAIDKYLLVQHRGSYFKINQRNNKKLSRILDECCEALDIEEKPELYLQQGFISAYTVGVEQNLIVLSTAMETIFTTDEIKFVIGHELGHIKSNHSLYLQMANILPNAANFLPIPILNTVISTALQIPMLYWARMAEYTADRAGLLACQNLEAAISVFAKASGLPLSKYNSFDIEDFLSQINCLEEFNESFLDKSIQAVSIMFADHPWIMSRAKELKKWVDDGDYSNVFNTSYDKNKNYVRGKESFTNNQYDDKIVNLDATEKLIYLKQLLDRDLISKKDFDLKKKELIKYL